MTKTCANKSKEALNKMVTTMIEARSKLEDSKPKMVNHISPHEEEWGACYVVPFI